MKQLERLLKALANRRRLEILRELKKHNKLPVGEIARRIRLSLHATSKHLRILSVHSLIDADRQGMQIYYHRVQDIPPAARRIIDEL